MSSVKLLLLALFLLLPSSGTVRNPPVTWSSASLSHAALSGTASVVSVSFTSSEPLTNVRLSVVPELARFVSTIPSTIDAVPVGVEQTVVVVVAIPKETTAQTIEGTIQIKDAHRTVARPLPIVLTTRMPTATDIPPSVALPSADRITSLPEEDSIVFVKDELDLFVKEGVSADTVQALVSQFGGRFLGSSPEDGFYQVELPHEGFDGLLTAINQLSQVESVDLVTPHFFLTATNFPDDPGADLSYGPDLIHLAQAWDITTGKKQNDTAIAVVDTVFDFNHVDLKQNITLHNSNTAPFGEPHHGTRVASIIGAKGNNFLDIAGVMWNASLHLYSAGKYDDPTNLDGALMNIAFSKAIRDGARVLNLSWDAHCQKKPCTAQAEQALKAMDDGFIYFINLAKSKLQKNLLWVFAADNEGADIQTSSPARLASRFPNVVTVSAVNSQRQLSPFSNYGKDVTTAAPGERIFSLTPGGGYDDGTFTIPIIGWKLDSYGSGTSYSAPYVSGVAGLILSVNPNLTAEVEKVIIKYSSEDTTHRDPQGHQVFLVDANRAVQSAQSAFQFSDGSYLVKVDYPSSRVPDRLPTDFPLEDPGNLVTQNYVAAVTDGRFQQTREFVTTRTLNSAGSVYRNYFLSHGWQIIFDQDFGSNFKVLLAHPPNGGVFDLLSIGINENTITHVRTVDLTFTSPLD